MVACEDFEAGDPVVAPEAGVEAGADAAVVDASQGPEDAGACAKCRSGQCFDDGGCFPVVFVTAESYQGDFKLPDGGIARADEVCNLAGNADAPVPTKWRAWLSTNDVDAITRITDGFAGADRPVVDVKGTRIAESYGALVGPDAGLLAPIATTQKGGVAASNAHVWTGTSSAGKRYDDTAHCLGWTTGSGYSGRYGTVGFTNAAWTSSGAETCDNFGHLYCFEVIP